MFLKDCHAEYWTYTENRQNRVMSLCQPNNHQPRPAHAPPTPPGHILIDVQIISSLVCKNLFDLVSLDSFFAR